MSSRSALRYSVVGLLLSLLLLTPNCFGGVTREVTRTYPLNADGSFELNNVNGTVRIEAWDKDEVEVRAVKSTPDQEALLDMVAIDVDSKPEALTISTRYPQEEGVEVAVDYTIHVPRRAQLNHVTNVNGTLRVVSSESVGELHTVNGNIEVYEGGGNVRAHTTNGSVLLAVPADMPADLEARCMNGNFSSELPLVMGGAEQPRTLHGKLGHGGAPIHLSTVNGAIRVVALRSTV